MAGVKSDISLQIKNNLNRVAKFSILGGTQDPSNGQANAKTIYEWDLSAETFANTNVLTIEASTVTNPTIITYEISNQDGAIEDLKTVVRLLNTLNLGVFNLDGNVIWIIDDINIFGSLEVAVSFTFNINDFVTNAYNYFDPLGQTSLPTFLARWTPSIQQAVNTVPNFVSNINTQGWGLAYPITETVSAVRSVSGDAYVVTNATTTLYGGTSSINQSGTGDAIVYMSDMSIWSNMFSFILRASAVNQNIIFKYIANAPFGTIEFQPDVLTIVPPPTLSWIPLNFANFPSYVNNTSLINITDVNTLDLMGAYPSIAVLEGSSLEFRSINFNNYNIELSPVGGTIDFGSYPVTLGANATLVLNRLINTPTNNIALDFSTLNLSGQFQTLTILQGFGAVQTFNLSPEFNTKFTYGSLQRGQAFTLSGEGSGGSEPIITFDDDVTPLTLTFSSISFEFSNITNLPPLNLVGYNNAPTYQLNLNIADYSGVVTFLTQYYNDWLGKLVAQSFLNDSNITTISGSLDITALSNYTLSGRGVSGYYGLLEQGLTIFTNFSTILNNSFSFTLSSGGNCIVNTRSGIAGSNFDIDVSEKNVALVTESSVAIAPPFTEEIDFGVVATEKDCIFTLDPTIPCTSLYIGKNPSFIGQDDTLSNLVIGNGIFGQTLGAVTINGLTLTFDIDTNNQGGVYGLYNRDFSGLNSTNTTELFFENLNINCISIPKVGITGVTPYGTTSLINIPTTNPIPTLAFTNSLFGVSNPITSNVFRPLNSLFDVGAINNLGTSFIGCSFGLNNLPSNETDVYFAINDNDGGNPRNALLGSSVIQNCQFATVGQDRLILEANYNGVGNSISSLSISSNPQLFSVQLLNTSGSTPPACSISLINNLALEEFLFQDYNLNTISSTITSLPSCNLFRVEDNDLNSASLDIILLALDNNGITNGILNYSNQTSGASPNIGVSGVAYNNLIAKGWVVTGNVPI